MKKSVLVSAIVFLTLGLILLGAGLAMTNFNYRKLMSQKYNIQVVNETLTPDKDVTEINVDLSVGAFELVYGDQFAVELINSNYVEYSATVENGVISVKSEMKRTWWIFGGMFWDVGVKLTVPSTLDNIAMKIEVNNSSLKFENMNFTKLDLSSSNAAISLKDITCVGAMDLETSNAHVTLENVQCDSKINVETSNSKVTLNNVKSNMSIDARTSNGKIYADNVESQDVVELVSSNNGAVINAIKAPKLVVKTSNDSINAKGLISDDIYLNTSNSSITAEVVGTQSDYTIYTRTSHGNSNVNDSSGSTNKKLRCDTSNANINIYFV